MTNPPLLAADLSDWDFDLDRVPYPVLATPKIDGIRAVVSFRNDIKAVLSRSLKPIPNFHIYARMISECPVGLDGELIVPNATFQSTTSAVMSHTSPLQVDFRYQVFDYLSSRPYRDRCIDLARLDLPDFCDKIIPSQINSPDELIDYEARCLAAGHEGVMLRAPLGPWVASKSKTNRSTLSSFALVKLKRFATDEATLVGMEPLYHNANEATTNEKGLTQRSTSAAGLVTMDKLGSFTVRHPSYGTFSIGTGFTDADRHRFWRDRERLFGSLVAFKYLPHGMKDKPRHPVFRGFRDPSDT